MKDLIFLTIPYLGRFYVQRDTITLRRWELENLTGPLAASGFCAYALRVYLTPEASSRAEG